MKCWLAACLCLLMPTVLASSSDFGTLLEEAELAFEAPVSYVDIAPGRTPMLDYERAIRSPEGDVEVRFAVRPLKRLQIEYDDPHGATPDPNHIFPLVFESLASRLAGGRHAPSNEYAPEQAEALFNADWAAAAVFDTVADFDTEFRQGLLVAIHRNQVADAYTVVLFNDYAGAKPQINAAIRSLRFLPLR